MALDFLSSTMSPSDSSVLGSSGSSSSNPLGLISNLLNLGGQVSGINTTLQGYQPTAAATAQNQDMSNQNALLSALLDPTSTIYKNVVASQNQQLNNQTQQGLQSLLQMNRKAQLMGRQTFFNPERQDEAVSQYLGNQSTTNAATARSNALNQIISAANGYGQAAGNYGKMIPQQTTAQQQNNNALPTSLSQIGSLLGQFGSGGAMSSIGSALSSFL